MNYFRVCLKVVSFQFSTPRLPYVVIPCCEAHAIDFFRFYPIAPFRVDTFQLNWYRQKLYSNVF